MQGYHFSRALPAAQCMVLLRERRRLLHAQRGASGPILLIVDDDPSVVLLFEKVLDHERYRILTATDANRALELLAGNEVGVVLADQNMPGMSGVELLRRIKGLYPETVRIMISNREMPRAGDPFQVYSPITLMMTRFARWPSNSA